MEVALDAPSRPQTLADAAVAGGRGDADEGHSEMGSDTSWHAGASDRSTAPDGSTASPRPYPEVMVSRIPIAEEVGAKKAFAWAIDWPGWARSGKTAQGARETLLASAPRYSVVVRVAKLPMPAVDGEIDVVESVTGGSGTDFGVPSAITDADRRPVSAAEAERLATLIEAAWTIFDRVAATSPASLRKGPRGGGRDRDKMIRHVIEADHAYARELGIRLREAHLGDVEAIRAERDAVLDLLRQPSDGGPLADRRWTQRYAARRIAWHALDHAWEMEDRAEPE